MHTSTRVSGLGVNKNSRKTGYFQHKVFFKNLHFKVAFHYSGDTFNSALRNVWNKIMRMHTFVKNWHLLRGIIFLIGMTTSLYLASLTTLLRDSVWFRIPFVCFSSMIDTSIVRLIVISFLPVNSRLICQAYCCPHFFYNGQFNLKNKRELSMVTKIP